MTDPDAPSDDDRDRILRLIMARCPELSEADLALLGDTQPDPDMLPASIGAQILDVISHMADRLDALEKAVRTEA
jgi:hypothetical protein